MLRCILCALALAGCASTSQSSPRDHRAEMKRERVDEQGQALRDEFNRLTSDAY